MTTVTEVSRFDELESYRLVWMSLWQQTPGACDFDSLDWLRSYGKQSGVAHGSLRVLVVSSRGGTIGILPLVATTRGASRFCSSSALRSPQHSIGSPSSVLGPNPTATLCAAARYLSDTQGTWNSIQLDLGLSLCRKALTAFELAGLPHRAKALPHDGAADRWRLVGYRGSLLGRLAAIGRIGERWALAH
jgi:hypothetical protein